LDETATLELEISKMTKMHLAPRLEDTISEKCEEQRFTPTALEWKQPINELITDI
jgi:hypothetical protein